MFTGLVETLGTVRRVVADGSGKRIVLAAPELAPELAVGDSVAVNGACLSVVECAEDSFHFQAGPETLLRTNLGELSPGERVNLERSLRLGDRLGGHLVQGHVDGLGRIAQRVRQGDWETVWFSCAPALTLQMVSKGSVAVDGVSLTLVDVAQDRFSTALIPHTLEKTTLGFKQPGATVNLETDVFAKYLLKMVQHFQNLGTIPSSHPD